MAVVGPDRDMLQSYVGGSLPPQQTAAGSKQVQIVHTNAAATDVLKGAVSQQYLKSSLELAQVGSVPGGHCQTNRNRAEIFSKEF